MAGRLDPVPRLEKIIADGSWSQLLLDEVIDSGDFDLVARAIAEGPCERWEFRESHERGLRKRRAAAVYDLLMRLRERALAGGQVGIGPLD